ncbi:VTC domain-containing protein [Chloroflexota bacterium]
MTYPHQDGTSPEHTDRRIERKFFVPPQNIGLSYALLRQFCHQDKEYPDEQINSLYFDTDNLDQYEKSSSGEYSKNKIRIRWYHSLDNYQEEVPIFVEIKLREGFATSKIRRRFLSPVDNLETTRLHEGIISADSFIDTIASFGYFPDAPIRPVIVISYRRYRFTEMLTGMRVALDYQIRSTIINRALGYVDQELTLAGGVIEVKGHRLELPETLRRMSVLDLDWSRFSKYSSCLDAQLSGPDTLAGLWPVGRLNAD